MPSIPSHVQRAAVLAQLSGSICSIRFHNDETGYCVLRVFAKGHKHQVTVVGISPTVTVGEYLEASGHWESHPSHGEQFKADELRSLAPRTVDGIVRFLQSGVVKGIGKTYAKKLGEKFGEELADVITNRPALLEKVPGIGVERRKQIQESWAAFQKQRDLLLFLHSYGISGSVASKLCKTYGEKAGEIVRSNPYRICSDVDGIGFKTADQIASKLGISPDSQSRIRAGISHVIKTLSMQGDCYVTREVLVTDCRKLLAIPENEIEHGIETGVRNGDIIHEDTEKGSCYFLPMLHQVEKDIAEEIVRINKGPPPWPDINIEAALDWAQKKISIILAPSQREAIRLVLKSKVSIITGGPGTGKSTILKCILMIVRAKRMEVLQGAPTGRAARRMAEATGVDAATLHRLLGYNGRTRRYEHDADNPLPTNFIVTDEASMLGVWLCRSLLKAVRSNAGLLFLGDVDQLPSIEPGKFLFDLIESGTIPVARLTEIHRQGKGSSIVTCASMINQGFVPDISYEKDEGEFQIIAEDDPEAIQKRLIDLVCDDLPSKYGLDPRKDIQVLTPMHKGMLGTLKLNQTLQHILSAGSPESVQRHGVMFRENDKVIQMVNDHDREVYNGDIGILERIDNIAKHVTVNFDGRHVAYSFPEMDELNLGWAITTHKSQGSEWDAVVVPLTMEHFMLLDRRLLYTAITRAKSRVVLIGQRRALKAAVANVKSHLRSTRLAQRLHDSGYQSQETIGSVA
ncbi:MAG: SF1B family DNA helicase RecD2 [Sulfuricaulis sp.]